MTTTTTMRERFASLYAHNVERYPYPSNYEDGRREFSTWLERHDRLVRRGKSSELNRILQDAREYHLERRSMNNPKGWKHVLRVAADAGIHNVYKGIEPEHSRIAFKVLVRLARLDSQ